MTKVPEDDLKHLELSEFDEVRLTDIKGTTGALVWRRPVPLLRDSDLTPSTRYLLVIVDDAFDEGAVQRVRHWLRPAG